MNDVTIRTTRVIKLNLINKLVKKKNS